MGGAVDIEHFVDDAELDTRRSWSTDVQFKFAIVEHVFSDFRVVFLVSYLYVKVSLFVGLVELCDVMQDVVNFEFGDFANFVTDDDWTLCVCVTSGYD